MAGRGGGSPLREERLLLVDGPFGSLPVHVEEGGLPGMLSMQACMQLLVLGVLLEDGSVLGQPEALSCVAMVLLPQLLELTEEQRRIVG